MDFTIKRYTELVESLKERGFQFLPFKDFYKAERSDTVCLRHDVDKWPRNSLRMASYEYELGVKSTYFFRMVKGVWDPLLAHEIAELGHEIGYHYEDLAACKGDYRQAMDEFKKQLKLIRRVYPVKTICMHGRPLSNYDSRDLWNEYNYEDYGIVAEPYFDVDYSEVFYITDTGRSWRSQSANLRDTVDSGFDLEIKSTRHFIELIQQGKVPERIMINTHPQRWNKPGLKWFRELVGQNIKNVAKILLIRYRNNP